MKNIYILKLLLQLKKPKSNGFLEINLLYLFFPMEILRMQKTFIMHQV